MTVSCSPKSNCDEYCPSHHVSPRHALASDGMSQEYQSLVLPTQYFSKGHCNRVPYCIDGDLGICIMSGALPAQSCLPLLLSRGLDLHQSWKDFLAQFFSCFPFPFCRPYSLVDCLRSYIYLSMCFLEDPVDTISSCPYKTFPISV